MTVPMQSGFDGPEISWFALSPMLVLVGTALVLLVGGALLLAGPEGPTPS